LIGANHSQQPVFAELSFGLYSGFGYSIGEENQSIAGREIDCAFLATPFAEHSQDGRRCRQPLDSLVGANQNGRQMAAIHVAQAPSPIIVIPKE
jgi:hypothetical protein